MRNWLILIVLAVFALAAAAARAEPPLLRIETGAHSGKMGAAATDAAGDLLLTGGNDKTARLWSLPDLRPLGVLRPPIGAGDAGKVYAVALSPDGRLAAVGGWLGSGAGDQAVLLFDTRTHQVTRRWADLPNVVDALAFAPDGARLAAGFRAGGLQVWRVADGQRDAADTDYNDGIYGLSFATDGSLAAASLDGAIRRYDAAGRRQARVATVAGKQPFRIAFNPAGTVLAIGFADAAAVELRDARTLAALARPDVSGLQAHEFERVAWSRDGRQLLAGGDAWTGSGNAILGWPEGGRGQRFLFDAGFSDPTGDIAPLPGGAAVVTSLGGDIAVARKDAGRSARVTPDKADLNTSINPSDPTRRLLLAQDGRRVAWTQGGAAGRWDMADTTGFAVTSARSEPNGLANWRARDGALEVTGWDQQFTPRFAGHDLSLEQYERSRSVAVAGKRLLLGASWSLRLFDGNARQLWSAPVPGAAWRVNQSADGRLAVAAFGDGTVRWFRLDDGRELLALFTTRDASRWVAFTPSGYYTASPGGEDLIGWQVNRGPDQAADFFPASRFRDTYYRPDVVTRVLDTLDEAEALRLADAARETLPAPKPAFELPPVIAITAPRDNTTLTGDDIAVEYVVRSPSGHPVRNVEARLDGRPIPGGRGLDPLQMPDTVAPDAETRGRMIVPVPAGQTVTLSLLATSDTGRVSDPALLRLHGAARAPIGPARPALNAVLVGVSAYRDTKLALRYAAADATALRDVLLRQKNANYWREVNVTLVPEGEATRARVIKELHALRRLSQSGDVTMVFLSGHGVPDEGRVFFAPVDVDPDNLSATAVSQDDITEELRRVPGRVMAFLDICHAAGAAALHRGTPDMTLLTNMMRDPANGLIVFAASTARQDALELPEFGHGAFTQALLEGLGGKAEAGGKGFVTVFSLQAYLAGRVRDLTGGRQAPVLPNDGKLPDFPLLLLH